MRTADREAVGRRLVAGPSGVVAFGELRLPVAGGRAGGPPSVSAASRERLGVLGARAETIRWPSPISVRSASPSCVYLPEE